MIISFIYIYIYIYFLKIAEKLFGGDRPRNLTLTNFKYFLVKKIMLKYLINYSYLIIIDR